MVGFRFTRPAYFTPVHAGVFHREVFDPERCGDGLDHVAPCGRVPEVINVSDITMANLLIGTAQRVPLEQVPKRGEVGKDEVAKGNDVVSVQIQNTKLTQTLEDYDECSAGDHHCSQLCNNTAGGYSCYCGEGYYTDEEKDHLCLDIDECYEETDNCTDLEVCGNDPGSFHCNCTQGAVLVGGICVPGTGPVLNDHNTNADNKDNNDTDHQCQHNYGTHYYYSNNVHYYSASNHHHHHHHYYYYCSSIHS
ncbi:HMCN1 [Branchiostoma lanceolatum]|uniref:HMCN1 protein n=1 Tax=Branchiostoma lanceolatum TaxID=7740 RepID=A0A8J9YPB5_BRALA|nr:HMCN1 [Branchiostoma lanceolatum]